MSRRSLFILCALAAIACEQAPRDTLASLPKQAPTSVVKQRSAPPDAAYSLVALRLERELPEKNQRDFLRCPDETLSHADAEQNTLLVRVRDARSERKNILPLDLRQTLAPDPLARWRESTASIDEGEKASLASLKERRYLAEIVISAFAPPTHFRRLNALHSEWSAGRLEGELVVYDLDSEHVLCAAPLRVHGDATGAPLSRRLREATRADLERKLYARAVREVGGALASITHLLHWPSEPLALSRVD